VDTNLFYYFDAFLVHLRKVYHLLLLYIMLELVCCYMHVYVVVDPATSFLVWKFSKSQYFVYMFSVLCPIQC